LGVYCNNPIGEGNSEVHLVSDLLVPL
jgi:hypothetical protein